MFESNCIDAIYSLFIIDIIVNCKERRNKDNKSKYYFVIDGIVVHSVFVTYRKLQK